MPKCGMEDCATEGGAETLFGVWSSSRAWPGPRLNKSKQEYFICMDCFRKVVPKKKGNSQFHMILDRGTSPREGPVPLPGPKKESKH